MAVAGSTKHQGITYLYTMVQMDGGFLLFLACEEGPGICSLLLTVFSILLVVATLPFSLVFVIKVVQVWSCKTCRIRNACSVQEYERAVIFRLGLLITGGTRGPGVFFVIPCVDVFEKIDMRTQTFNVPPQEVEY